MPLITRGISLVNFMVASSALAFQVFVLYPWHNQLDDEFKALKREHLKVLGQIDRITASERYAVVYKEEATFRIKADFFVISSS
ncbi:uncharacterized protein BDV14DRAFT_195188 [Aspergillus stella-maris]|uniref:uncharacterized protein n=1 Tax=Aspergillus stella-maris TaxID=1810926 RepID=UPI003CCCC0CB